MATNYPTSLDDGTSLPTPTTGNNTNSPSHAGLHATTGDAVKAIEAKVGTGASTPTANKLLFGTGTGTSSWTALTSAQLAATLSDETGTGSAVFATTPTLVTPKVDTINESTPANGVTIDGLNIKDNALNTNNSVVTSNITDGAVTFAKVANGIPVQVVSTGFSAVATGTTVLPFDDTIPQITEGIEFMTQAITPKSTTNILLIDATLMLSHSAAAFNFMAAALFQDSTANALAAQGGYTHNTAGEIQEYRVLHTMTAGTTSSTTFRIRAGCNAVGTTTLNGQTGTRVFGAITKSSVVITEYKA